MSRQLVTTVVALTMGQAVVSCYDLTLPERPRQGAAGHAGAAGSSGHSSGDPFGGTAGTFALAGSAGTSAAAGAPSGVCPTPVDCGESACNELGCGDFGQKCVDGLCHCPGQQTKESSCSDGLDNDCDGNSDCKDADCSTLGCGSNGRVCKASACVCPHNQASETSCSDKVDNDCDGKVDCADSDCNTAQCGSSPNQRCCSNACVDTETNEQHCQGCGLACNAGQTCKRIADSVGTRGHCTCGIYTSYCPKNPNQVCRVGNNDGQDGLCACDLVATGNAGCAAGQICKDVPAGANFCHY